MHTLLTSIFPIFLSYFFRFPFDFGWLVLHLLVPCVYLTCNISNISTGNTLHSIKFHRRRKYKKLARLALSTPAIPQQMDVDVDVDMDREFDMEMDTPVPLKNAVCRK